ncbi:MAG: terminase, partial [Opitutales bacterium]
AQTGGFSESEYRIKRRNTWVASAVAALPSGALERRAVKRTIPNDARVVLFFDGSFNHDCTALLAATIEAKPHLFVVSCWERPPDNPHWTVPMEEVDAVVRATCRDRTVVELACDPYRWKLPMEQWEAAGLPVVTYETTSPQRMVPAWSKFYDAVLDGSLTTDGDARLERHARNTKLKTDRLGPRPVKEHRGSPRAIDLLICAVGAFDRATFNASTPVAVVPEFITL